MPARTASNPSSASTVQCKDLADRVKTLRLDELSANRFVGSLCLAARGRLPAYNLLDSSHGHLHISIMISTAIMNQFP